jgi:cytochrome c oxidase cbb3-type subunit 4
MNYHILREIADSWVLLLMVLFFLGVIGWSWRPGSRVAHRDAVDIPFRHEDRPAPPTAQPGKES